MGQNMEPIIEHTLMDNPLATYAQTLHDEQEGRGSLAGKAYVARNLTSIIGGFSRFNGTELQNAAAKRFRDMCEAAQIGGGRACDPSVEPVDGGGVNPEAVFEIGADARREWTAVRKHIGGPDFKRLEFVIMGDRGPTAYARWSLRLAKPNSRAVSKAMVEVRTILLKLALFWNLAGSVSGRKEMAAWGDGTAYKMPSDLDEVA
jgi:hypothetical protein